MHIRQTGKLITRALFSIVVFGLVLSPQLVLAEISVDSYCQLAVQSLQQDVSNFQELIALVNQYKDDRETLNQQEEIKKAEFAQAKEALFSSFGITDTEYAMYMGKNRRAVEAYLEANPDIKQQIDDLSAQVGSLLEEYESLKGSGEPVPPPLP
jgi:outer membrane murein-binding lipoprotein Lpp